MVSRAEYSYTLVISRKMVMEIALNKSLWHCFVIFIFIFVHKVTLYKKFYMIYSFFVRKIIAHMFIFFFYYVVLPLTILVPKVYFPKWGAIYSPCIIITVNSVGTPRQQNLIIETELNVNHVRDDTYGDVVALNDEIEEESQSYVEALRIKEVLDNHEDEPT
ncbi:cellulose synthase like [Striga asiatica]|uniref:Cellulose synthase like n=1 Tax=Striga asiatica TaxID=4170 RepID=A0A5A7Q4W0_STRAF|nr:cellulose synthase like [Striga asiatica]